MKYIYIIILSFLLLSCQADESATINFTIDNKIYTRKYPKDMTEFSINGFEPNIEKIEGLENFKNLKKLMLETISGITDYSFLEILPNLEILIINNCACIIDFNFLNELSKLKILYIYGIDIKKNHFDFLNNKKLEFIALNGVAIANKSCKGIDTLFDLNIKNIPTNLKYLDLSLNDYLRFDKEFLENIESIPVIFLDSMDYKQNKDYFDKHLNFNFSFPDEILPQEYQFKELRKEPEHRFSKLEDLNGIK